ncbi:MAG TPA: formate dehydrogenase accessory protein FdhE [Thermodesulfobacteriota bacterium]
MTGGETVARLERLGRRDPSLAPVLGLYETALREADDRSWDAAVEPGPAAAGAPAIAHARLTLDPAVLREWTARLAAATDRLADGAVAASAARLDPAALVLAAVRLDDAALESLARAAGVLPETVAVLAHLAALPLLAAVGRRLGPAPAGWTHGGCPVCGAWPVLSELRGIENERHLRCGRCGSDWAAPWLFCPFCETTDHQQLGSLVLEAAADRRKIDVCRSCRGFLKALPTLKPLDPRAVVVEDLANVELDVAALERGFERPSTPPWAPLPVRAAGARARM